MKSPTKSLTVLVALLAAMTGRGAGLRDLGGDGLATLTEPLLHGIR
jgi:hypothetical protein